MDMKGGSTQREEGHRTRREEGHEEREDTKGRHVIDPNHLSLLPLGTFLARWFNTVRKTPDIREEKS